MAKRLTYTPAERKQAKSFRNKIYYYRRLDKGLNKIKQDIESAYSSVRNTRSGSGLNVTMRDVRHFIYVNYSEDINKELYYAGCFDEGDNYNLHDFRDVMIQKGVRESLIDSISTRAGYGSLQAWQQQFMQDLQSEPGYVNEQAVQQRQDQVQKALEAAENAFEGWKANVRNIRQGSNG